jgi:hypothetical protein
MNLTKEEIKFIDTAAKWFKENKNCIYRDEAMDELGIDDNTYETLIKKMELMGIVKDVSSAAGEGYAVSFEPTARAEILAREIEAKQTVPPDIIEQLKTRIRQNPWTAWPVIIFIVLAVLIPVINQSWELVTKFIKLFFGKTCL